MHHTPPNALTSLNALKPPNEIERARIAVADQLRRGTHGLVGKDHQADELRELAGRLEREFDTFASKPNRVKDPGKWQSPTIIEPPEDGRAFPTEPDRPVSGSANPWSVPLHVIREADRAVTTVTLGAAFEGAPGRSHGGVVSAIFDDLCGFCLVLERKLAYTAYITVSYKAATPLHVPLQFSAWIDERNGRKLRLAGECLLQGEVLTTCDALFLTMEGLDQTGA